MVSFVKNYKINIVFSLYFFWCNYFCFCSDISTELLYLDLFINNAKQDGVFAFVRQLEKIWFRSADFKLFNLADIPEIASETAVFYNENFRLLPFWVSAVIDRANLSIKIIIPPERMTVTRISEALQPMRQTPSIYGFFWNYDFSLNHQVITKRAQFISAHHPVIMSPYGSLSNQFITIVGDKNKIVRLETAYLLDISQQQRIIAGDFATDTPSFLSSVPALGFKYSKGNLFQSGSLSYPTLSLEGLSPTPGLAEIWLNNMLHSKKDIPMGGFVLDNIKLPVGASDGKLIIKDAQGIVSSIAFSHYGDPELLRPGLSAYSFSAGFLRKDYGMKSFSYGSPAFFGSYKFGVSNYWTPAFDMQASLRTLIGGSEQRFRLSNFGSTACALATSLSSQGLGFLVAPSLQLDIFHMNFKSRAIYSSTRYTPVSASHQSTKSSSINLSGALRLDAPYLKYTSLNYLLMLNNKDKKNILGLRQQIPAYQYINISLGADYDMYNSNFRGFLFLSYQPFERHLMTMEADQSYGRPQANADLMGNKSSDNYYLSYGIGAHINNKFSGRGLLNFENSYLRSRLQVFNTDKNIIYTAGFAGAFEIMKNHFFISRPVEQGITLVEVPGQKNIAIYQNDNYYLGRTNNKGYLIIPNLVPHQSIKFSINNKNLSPYDMYEEYAQNAELTPGIRTAHEVNLSIKKVRHIRFFLMKNNKTLSPGTTIFIDNKKEPSFVMSDGSVYLDVAEDQKIISGHDDLKQCHFLLSLPERSGDIVEKLEEITCY
jgi:outer membrane usher protein